MKNIFLKKTLLLLFALTLVSIVSCYGQAKKYTRIYIHELYQGSEKIDNETDSIIEIEDPREDEMLGIFTNDSIYIFYESYLYTLEKVGDSISLFVIRDEQIYDIYVYKFDDTQNSVRVNDNIYYLTEEYYNYLKKEGVDQMNIMTLISLFTPGIEDFYNLSVLIDNVWVNVELAKGSRILRAEIYTESPHSDMLYSWNITYEYNDLDEITAIRKNNKKDNSLHFDLKLISKSDENYYYEIFLVDDGDRYSEQIKKYINKSTFIVSTYVERQQSGYTFKSATKILNRGESSTTCF